MLMPEFRGMSKISTLVFLTGESHGQRTWWAIVHRVRKVADTAEASLAHNACITVAMFVVNLGSCIPFDTRDILEAGLAWLYPWRVWLSFQGTEPPNSSSRKLNLLKRNTSF